MNEARIANDKLAAVTLVGVDDGVWSIEWWDTLAGKCLTKGEVTASGGALRLEPPAFQVDIAVRLKKRAMATE